MPVRYRYAGPPPERAFCRAHLGRVYTRAEIAALPSEQGLPPLYYGGGYGCRHRWVIVIGEPGPDVPAPALPEGYALHARDASGGYVAVHSGHDKNNLPSELRVAEALMRQGRRVLLLDESSPVQGVKKVDFDVDGERWEAKMLSALTPQGRPVNVRTAVQNHVGSASRKEAEGLGIDVQHPDAPPERVIGNVRVKLARAETRRLQTVVLVYPDGRTLTYRRDEITPEP